MSAPQATRAQLALLVERALSRVGDHAGARAPVLFVHADPQVAPTPALGEIGDKPVTVRASRSPLQIRAWLREPPPGPLVVLTDCGAADLGDDVLARSVSRRVLRLDRWDSVCQLFGARRPSAHLVRRPHLADALIEARPVGGYPQVTSRVLDFDTAAQALIRTWLGVTDEVDDLAGFVLWASRPQTAGRLANARGRLLEDLRGVLEDRFGPGLSAVLTALDADLVSDLVPLGVAAGVVHAGGSESPAAIRLDERLGRPNLDSGPVAAWAEAAAEIIEDTSDTSQRAGWLERASTILDELGGIAQAHHSGLLPIGFDQRISHAGEALSRWSKSPDQPDLADAAHQQIERAATHGSAATATYRVERLRMISRLIRRRGLKLGDLGSLLDLVSSYGRDGAWLDAARVAVSQGDRDPDVAALCRTLTEEANTARAQEGERIARIAANAAQPFPSDLVGVEDVVDRIVGPVADLGPVLFVVLDGLGWPTFTHILGSLESLGWSPWTHDDLGHNHTALAALPTVTEVSRTSLLAGTLRRGDDASERRAFAAHPALQATSHANRPPMLFHKSHLRAGGIDAWPEEVLDAVADDQQHSVGVVINSIDDRLKDVAPPPDGWQLEDLDPLRHVLAEARRCGRAVVLTADHGHILDRDAAARTGGGGGERWRPPEPPAGDAEITIEGPRVVLDRHRAVVPWAEQLRYGPRHNGYHGGLTPQELLVPLAVLSVEDIPGWAPSHFARPSWWHHTRPRPTPAAAPVTPAPPPAQTPSLFDPKPAEAPASTEPVRAGSWITELFGSQLFTERRANPRVRLGDDELERLLTALDAAGSMKLAQARLAKEAGLPVARIGRYVAQLQDLMNVDGFAVVSVEQGEVRFDQALLERQFDL